ncbi:MAG: HEAT repeat domain-containing protein [Planctomycetota bacterium]|nr:HEAT repeat domain-containing protein [Planctomycetota bacterium]MCX8039971.1 HEAT repeat domain-containing protein [Planctomycetota bacterium]MDW8372961.1 HEAT repeat domain-containing protein [Planctomycetota bacterium]
MLRFLLVLAALAGLAAVDEQAVLAAARAASIAYQNHYASLLDRLQHPEAAQRIAAVRALARLRDPQSVPVLMAWLQDPQRQPQELADGIIAVASMGYTAPAALLRSFATHSELAVRQAASEGLHILGAIRAGDWMQQAREEDDALRLNAVVGLGQLAHAEAAPILLQGLRHPNRLVRRAACIGLGKLGDSAHGEALKLMLVDPDPGVRRYAAEALARLDYKAAIADLLMALEANIAGQHIARALRQLTGEDFGFDPHASFAARQAAIERGFVWLAEQRRR